MTKDKEQNNDGNKEKNHEDKGNSGNHHGHDKDKHQGRDHQPGRSHAIVNEGSELKD